MTNLINKFLWSRDDIAEAIKVDLQIYRVSGGEYRPLVDHIHGMIKNRMAAAILRAAECTNNGTSHNAVIALLKELE
jgi:hypothetical protein